MSRSLSVRHQHMIISACRNLINGSDKCIDKDGVDRLSKVLNTCQRVQTDPLIMKRMGLYPKDYDTLENTISKLIDEFGAQNSNKETEKLKNILQKLASVVQDIDKNEINAHNGNNIRRD